MVNILLLSHQLDFSGAPIALLRLAETLIRHGHAISLGTMQNGPLGAEFTEIGVQQFDASIEYDLYFANTFVTVPLALRLTADRGKIIAWIHESRQFFRLFGLDENKYGLSQLKRAVFPSKFMIDEYRGLMPNTELRQLRNFVSMDSIDGTMLYQDYFAVTGIWEPRKNQAGLLKLMDKAQLNIRCNFIGTEKPQTVSSAKHNFFGQLPLLESKMIIASSFGLISAAQTETQNLSAIEAILSGIPVVLSNIPAHRELKQLIPNIILFDINDPKSFAQGYMSALKQKRNVRILSENKEIAKKYFGHNAFDQAVRSLFS